MTPPARIAAAADILDSIAAGLAAEQALTRWARNSRFAGSKDRAAVRDHVFDALRQKQSAALLGGGETGRALMIGLLRAQGVNPGDLFTGQGHAPQPLAPDEIERMTPLEDAERVWNMPAWLIPEFERSLAEKAFSTAQALMQRAPICLRVNTHRTTRSDAVRMLAAEGVETLPNPLSATALTVTKGAGLLRNSEGYKSGQVELQDAASQAVIDLLPPAINCLDYCAGGGGKALALAAQPGRTVFAHDSDPNRMKDIAPRAARAGIDITRVDTGKLGDAGPFDLVLCDAPCSGSGAWRRAPGGKWAFSQDRLEALCALQDDILMEAAGLVAEGGTLAYATCSVLESENEDRVDAFLKRSPGWALALQRRFDVCAEGDGFFTAHLTRR